MFQGRERQDDLNMGWDSFKYRNYDYAIGRFFNIDPLAEKYPYNSTYAFQENKMGLGRELEGLELYPGPKPWLNPGSNNRLHLNIKIRTGTGVMWSKDANSNNSDQMTSQEKARANDHQPWYIDMDNGFNLMMSNFRPNAFPTKTGNKTTNTILKAKNIVSRGEKAKNTVEEGGDMMSGQTGDNVEFQNGDMGTQNNKVIDDSETKDTIDVLIHGRYNNIKFNIQLIGTDEEIKNSLDSLKNNGQLINNEDNTSEDNSNLE